MRDIMKFEDREAFRKWLGDNCLSEDGVWLLFGKAAGPKTLKAEEALEEALCFGWIDGQMQKIDDKTYKKYFSMRRENSKWFVKKTYTRAYFDAKTDAGREKRIAWMVDRLNRNLKPM